MEEMLVQLFLVEDALPGHTRESLYYVKSDEWLIYDC
jgi:hypothetical protein